MRFRVRIELHGKTATGIVVPPEVVESLKSGKRPPVRVTINGHTYRSTVATDLKAISSWATEEEAELNLELFAEKWDGLYPSISKSWRTQWTRVIPLFAFPADIRRVIYTTNAIESLNMALHKVTTNHRIFPSDEAVYKVIYLAMRNISKKWTMPIRDWKPALNRFAVECAERFPK
jgi:putative transposase